MSIYAADYARRMNVVSDNIMLQPGGFRAVTGGPSIFGHGYGHGYGHYGYGYGNYGYGYGNYGYGYGPYADDGKLTLGQKLKSMFKGAVKGAVNMVTGLFKSPGKLLLAAGCTALAIAFPPAGVVMGAIGAVKGVSTIIKSWDMADTATTDLEAKAAYENIGGGVLQTGLSVLAVKGGLSAMKNTTGSAMSELGEKASFGEKASAFWKDVKTCGRGADKTATGYKGAKLFDKAANTAKEIKDAGTYKGAKEVIKTKYQDAKLTRQLAKDAENQTSTTLDKANKIKTNAEKAKNDFESKWKESDGSYKTADGKETISKDLYESKIKELDESINNSTKYYERVKQANDTLNGKGTDSVGLKAKEQAENTLAKKLAADKKAGKSNTLDAAEKAQSEAFEKITKYKDKFKTINDKGEHVGIIDGKEEILTEAQYQEGLSILEKANTSAFNKTRSVRAAWNTTNTGVGTNPIGNKAIKIATDKTTIFDKAENFVKNSGYKTAIKPAIGSASLVEDEVNPTYYYV